MPVCYFLAVLKQQAAENRYYPAKNIIGAADGASPVGTKQMLSEECRVLNVEGRVLNVESRVLNVEGMQLFQL